MSGLAREQFNVVNGRSQRHFCKPGVVACPNLDVVTGHNGLADFQALRQKDVRLLAIGILYKSNQGRTVRVALDLGYPARNVVHVTRKVNNTIELTDTPTLVTNHDLARRVPCAERCPRHVQSEWRGGVDGCPRPGDGP